MKKMGSILMIILALLVAGCVTAPSIPSTPTEMVSLESPLYIISGENRVEGVRDF